MAKVYIVRGSEDGIFSVRLSLSRALSDVRKYFLGGGIMISEDKIAEMRKEVRKTDNGFISERALQVDINAWGVT